MPINNVCIQKRRLRELSTIIGKHTKFESLVPNGLDSYRQYNFIAPELSIKLIEELAKNGFEIAWIGTKRDKVLASVWNEVCPEKAGWKDKQGIKKGYRLRDKIDLEYWFDMYCKSSAEVRRLEGELKSKEVTVKQLCKRVVDIKNEKDELISGTNMFRLFFDTVELINK